MNNKIIQVNLGLENNPIQFPSTIADLFYEAGFNRITKASIRKGEYLDKEERTLTFYTSSRGSNQKIRAAFRQLCQVFGQECIALKINGKGYLEYNNNYGGEKMEFDNNFFIQP